MVGLQVNPMHGLLSWLQSQRISASVLSIVYTEFKNMHSILHKFLIQITSWKSELVYGLHQSLPETENTGQATWTS